MQGTPPITGEVNPEAIADAFKEVWLRQSFWSWQPLTSTQFVRVHQVLLNILIGKAGLFQTVPFIGQPVAAVLRQVENVVDVSNQPSIFVYEWSLICVIQTIAFSLIDIVEGQTDELQNQANSLGMTLKTAIGSYDGLALNKRAVPFKSWRTAMLLATWSWDIGVGRSPLRWYSQLGSNSILL